MKLERRTSASDQELAAALLQEGSESAFRELYRRYTPRLHTLVLRLLGGDPRDAEDALQDTWVRAIEGLERFRWQAAFPTWLHSIAVHVSQDALRRRQRGREDPWDDSVDPPQPEPPIGERLDLERAIALLPDGSRLVLVLHDVEGQPHEAIATQLGISIGTSKSQLHRARRALRTLLAPGAAARNER
jgi:RNA polymerase sigma-70 factor (ECF subfamily)